MFQAARILGSAAMGLLKPANLMGIAKGAGKIGSHAAFQYGVVLPALYATGIADPNRGKRNQPANYVQAGYGTQGEYLRDQVLYGQPERQGLFGSTSWWLGGQKGQSGLIEKRMNLDNQYRQDQMQAMLRSQEISANSDITRQRILSTANQILGDRQARRDEYGARQQTLSNLGSSMATIVTGGAMGASTPVNYAPTTAGLGEMQINPSARSRLNFRSGQKRNRLYGVPQVGGYGMM